MLGEVCVVEVYHDLIRTVLDRGVEKTDRTGTGTLSSFGHQMRFVLDDGFPLLTTKKTHFKSIVHELIWFLRGESNIGYLKENGVRIWNEWADESGELGPIYGVQWRKWRSADGQVIDQMANIQSELRTNPDSRRLLVSAWNVGELQKMALPPCHSFFQFYVAKGKLSCQLYQRSADLFLGVPFNIASYALLTHLMAQSCGLGVGDFIHSIGDAHLYLNHLPQANELLKRSAFPLPKLKINPEITSIFDFTYDDIEIQNYRFHPAIKAQVSV